ncbi:hypothetical protein DFH28DRAFT_1047454 [Melampsora americana]|nr:hypothetical protein DFH28DRAFT_1047454 [Melampsora americana]
MKLKLKASSHPTKHFHLALIAPFNFLNFLPMPISITVPNYNLKPINPFRRVPYPPASAGTETGLVCKSKFCRTRPTHSTVYQTSSHKHLTGVKCPIDGQFYRTYNSKHFYDQLRAINSRVNSSCEDMDLARLLSQPNAPPTPPATQQPIGGNTQPSATNSRHGAAFNECIGVHGHTAPGHNPRNNAKCDAQACKACCLKFYKGDTPCRKHTSMAKRKEKEIRDNGRISVIPSRTNDNVIDLISSSAGDSDNPIAPRNTQGGRAMGVRQYKGRMQTDFLDEFRVLTLQREAAERKRNVTVENASKTIALVVWHGSNHDHTGHWGGMVHAGSWPQFALGESVDIRTLVSQELGDSWSGNLQVWNEDNQLWLHTSLDILVTYPEKVRKILVVFPGLDPYACHEVKRHLASVSTGGRQESMNMTAFIQRNTPDTPKKDLKGKGKTIYLQSPSPPVGSQSPIEIQTTSDTLDNTTNNSTEFNTDVMDDGGHREAGLPQPNPKKRQRSMTIETSDIEIVQLNIPNAGGQWSQTATIRQLKEVYELSRDGPNKINQQAAFKKVFSNRFRFIPSTISHYCRWCDLIRPDRLDLFVAQHGDMTVASVRKRHFKSEWRASDLTRFEQHQPPKRVKL